MLANDKRGAGGQGNTRVTDLCKAHFHVDCSTAVGPANTWCLQKKKYGAFLTESRVLIYGGDG